MKYAYLMMVTTSNNNKFYELKQVSDSKVEIHYGRVGTNGAHTTCSVSQFESKKKAKLKKGYEDYTHLKEVEVEEVDNGNDNASPYYSHLENKNFAGILKKLFTYTKDFLSKNYEIKANSVTEAQVKEAYKILNELFEQKDNFKDKKIKSTEITKFNENLLKLFAVIPRKMTNVNNHLISQSYTISKIENLLDEEMETLSTMEQEVERQQRAKNFSNNQVAKGENDDKNSENDLSNLSDKDIMLNQLGVYLEEVDSKDIKTIKHKLGIGYDDDKFSRAWKVINPQSSQEFNKWKSEHKGETKLLWHGSRNENWYNIIQTSLDPFPKNVVITGKMFGYGIYFATRARKSLGYTSLQGSYWAGGSQNVAYMGLYEVAMGEVYHTTSWKGDYGNLKGKDINKFNNADTLFAHKSPGFLRNSEIIVYDKAQLNIKYLVELKN